MGLKKTALQTATELQDVLTECATGGNIGDDERYCSMRTLLISDPACTDLLPSIVKQCHNTTQFWRFIRGQFKTYNERRTYIWQQFRPLIEKLEASQAGSSTDPLNLDYSNPEPLINTLARIFAQQGAAAEVAVLANAKAALRQTGYEDWNAGTYICTLYLLLPYQLYSQLGDRQARIEKAIYEKARALLKAYPNDDIAGVEITAELSADPKWREKAKAWVDGRHITNQGRVRSDNIASRQCDGLLFRSQPEIHLYNALKAVGVSFAPLPVFIRGGQIYNRIEPDFVIVQNGMIMIVEVDGDTVHHETPAEAHARTTMLVHEGAHVERVNARDCETPEMAKACADRLLRALSKLKAAK